MNRKRYVGPGLLRRRFCSPSFGYAFARESALRCRWCLSEVFSSLGAPPSTNTAAATAFITVHVTWSPAQSAALYRVYGWRALYFSVNSSGNISSRPHGVGTLAHQEINLFKVVKKVSEPKSFAGAGFNSLSLCASQKIDLNLYSQLLIFQSNHIAMRSITRAFVL
ncbi:Arginine decarboxylase [Forsythia ovata]|uniref:Arginine decarboxylase n=1 Tax=Forsythia ovata TaxID=205694 RepID=A0ABD1T8K8_9LAMI